MNLIILVKQDLNSECLFDTVTFKPILINDAKILLKLFGILSNKQSFSFEPTEANIMPWYCENAYQTIAVFIVHAIERQVWSSFKLQRSKPVNRS